MKTLFLAITLLFSNLVYCQEIQKLKLTSESVEPIVVKVDGLSSSDIYTKALNWVQETYKNPDKVLKAKIEDEKIRIEGYVDNAWWLKTFGIIYSFSSEYTVEISFKDGRYRFKYIVGQFYSNGEKLLYGHEQFFKQSGEVKRGYRDSVPSLEQTMNDLSLSFYSYVSGETSEKDDDW